MLRLVHKYSDMKGSVALLCLLSLFFFSACSPDAKRDVDKLNSSSYAFHYRNLDSAKVYADSAFHLSKGYDAGRAEALNNLAFVSTIRMDFKRAYEQLREVAKVTDNQIELLVADVQLMRLCQRESKNKEFYDHRESALRRMRRIDEEKHLLSDREYDRLVYAQSEFDIVTSTYYYYVGLEQQSSEALMDIDADELEQDTAQFLSYLYNIGAGGIITQGTQEEINQKEFDHLLRCMLLSRQGGFPYWEANSMQAISEHLQSPEARRQLIADNLPAMKFINTDDMPDSLLAGYLAQKSLDTFQQFGDVYQTAGAYRTLASCYMGIGDFPSAQICLDRSLETNRAIEQAPDLVASIREQMSVVYAAMDDKVNSDYNRNLYLDLQEQTRQDRQLEARAEQLEKSSRTLNWMMAAVVIAIILVVLSLLWFDAMRRRSNKRESMERLLQPLQEWKQENDLEISELNERYDEINEAYSMNVVHIANSKKRNLENRAKVFLVNSILPFIDRMLHEIKCLTNSLENHSESAEKRQERYQYISELCDQINDYNDVLTQWIQLRQGELSLHIESFPLQQLFDTMQKSRMSFQLKGIDLQVDATPAVVKADRILTLFMLNTIADNARKFTPKGGKVTIHADDCDKYVEISVADTGRGMSSEEMETIFHPRVIVDSIPSETASSVPASHGFGLMNCKGIIDKYRKISSIFSVCTLAVESQIGEGSRFYFRLPKGIRKAMAVLALLLAIPVAAQESHAASQESPAATHESPAVSHELPAASQTVEVMSQRAEAYADSAYFSNLNGTFRLTLQYADSVRHFMNQVYHALRPNGIDTLLQMSAVSAEPPEIRWYHDRLPLNYGVLLDIRNESAVAALALHEWPLYRYNNKVYTQLFKETSADENLGEYCRIMQRSEINKQVAVSILVILLLLLLPAYYLLYYRHRLYYRFCVERVKRMNNILLSDTSLQEKQVQMAPLAREKYPPMLQQVVEQIEEALHESLSVSAEKLTNIELAEDECRRAELEDEKLHISNSVLDNCLSTLKHETMYYPSRIRQLIDGRDEQLLAISELANYYKELYSLLSEQAMRQVEAVKLKVERLAVTDILPANSQVSGERLMVLGDRDMLKYLFDLLKSQSGEQSLRVSVSSRDDHYAVFSVAMPHVEYDAQTDGNLFTPSMTHIPYLLCRQIVRDHSEQTARRGCGMAVEADGQGGINMLVTLTKTRNNDESI